MACGSSWKVKKVDKTLVNTLVDRLTGVKANKVKETLTDVKGDLLVEAIADTLAVVTAVTLWAMWRPLHWSTRLLTR